ncbi:hypothetical protein BOSE21B_110477 [Bosea sp. 21B]|nr:hypothetical protein BOSE21B_110477 [Bosea sp. 21B]VXB93820.1 hypothetical protein BOSE125_160215 [Bosea sp. 125]
MGMICRKPSMDEPEPAVHWGMPKGG